jgi:tripartite-type tricarboxylate transporter receptor subunit TctC
MMRISCVIALLATLATGAAAQSYPSRPITLDVPFAAGGPTDTIARVLAQRMSVSLGQNIVIENVSGADGTIGVGRVARARPDGYTLSFGDSSTHVLNGAAYALSYDVLNDFAPVALISSNPLLIVTNRDVPAANLKELIAWIKANQDIPVPRLSDSVRLERLV